MIKFLKKIFVSNLDNVNNQKYFTEDLKKSREKVDGTLSIEGERMTVTKKQPAKIDDISTEIDKKMDGKPQSSSIDQRSKEQVVEKKEEPIQNKQDPKEEVKQNVPQAKKDPVVGGKEEKPQVISLDQRPKEQAVEKKEEPIQSKKGPKVEIKQDIPQVKKEPIIERKEEKLPIKIEQAVEKKEEVSQIKKEPKTEIKEVVPQVQKEPLPIKKEPVVEPVKKEPETKPIEVKKEIKLEVPAKEPETRPIEVKKEESQEDKKTQMVNIQVKDGVGKIKEQVEKPLEDAKPSKVDVIKIVKDVNDKLSTKDLKVDTRISIDTKDIERRIHELEDLVYEYSDKIFKSEDKKEIDYYIKELERIIKEINDLIVKLNDGKELVKIEDNKISNKEEFLANYERLTTKLGKLKEEYVNKELNTAKIKRDLIEENDKEKDKKMSEAERQAKEAEYFQKKIDNDLYYIIHIKKRIDEITETRERIQRTYVGMQRVMNTVSRGLLIAAILPGPLKALALIGMQLRTAIGVAREMINPTFRETTIEETTVIEDITTTRSIDDSEIYKAEKELDEIIKDFDYLMKECYRLFNENPNYKDLFEKLKEIKYNLDSQKQELADLQKTTSKQLVLQREPIKETE